MDADVQRLATAGDAIAAARARHAHPAAGPGRRRHGGGARRRWHGRRPTSRRISERIVAARATLLDGTSLTALPTSDRLRIGTIDAAIAAAGELPGYWQQSRGRGIGSPGPAAGPGRPRRAGGRGDRLRPRRRVVGRPGGAQGCAAAARAGARGARDRPQGRSRRLHPRRPARPARYLRRGARRPVHQPAGHPTARRPRSRRAALARVERRTGEPARRPDGDGRHHVGPRRSRPSRPSCCPSSPRAAPGGAVEAADAEPCRRRCVRADRPGTRGRWHPRRRMACHPDIHRRRSVPVPSAHVI